MARPAPYQHIQTIPNKVFYPAAIGLGGMLSFILYRQGGLLRFLLLLSLLGLAGASLYGLAVRVDEKHVRLRYGGGLFEKRIPLQSIHSCKVVRNNPLMGWGIRFIGKGWLYNIYGLDAVEVVMQDGRLVRIGSDEPHRLAEAIEARIQGLSSP